MTYGKALLFFLISNCALSQTVTRIHNPTHQKFVERVLNIYFEPEDEYLFVQSCDTATVLDTRSFACLNVDTSHASGTYRLLLISLGMKKGLANYVFILLVEPIAVAADQEVIKVDYQRQVLREVYFGIRDNILLEIGEEIQYEPR